MRPEEIRELVRRQPFVPMRLHVTDGKTYDIRHPENVLISRGRVDIGVSDDPASGVAERVDFVSLLHIVRSEDITPSQPPASNGQTS
jgi:hypothetical protein